jgi:hypothetical protein
VKVHSGKWDFQVAHRLGFARFRAVCLSLAYIGTAANKKLGDELCAYPRRFRLGGKKEAAGVCRGRGESMEFQSQTANNERVVTLLDKAGEAISSGPWPQYMPQLQRPRRLRLRSCRPSGQNPAPCLLRLP